MSFLHSTDETLVLLTLAGKQDAYGELVLRYEKRVLAAAYRITRSRYMAEDAAQDAFVMAWMKLNLLREPSKFGAWVTRIAVNTAKNTVMRMREYLSIELLEQMEGERDTLPEGALIAEEEYEALHDSIETLPDRVKTVIYLHYFEGLSIAEIAAKLHVPAGTVKWQLHDGRCKLRKELSAMNEHDYDTLVEKVLKKVEELKEWGFVSDKSGFAAAYADTLAAVESLPESTAPQMQIKQHALAEVLMRGWWWLADREKNDALFARLKEAAVSGHNDEVMRCVVGVESDKLSGEEKLSYMRDTQIPYLRENRFPLALGYTCFWLGVYTVDAGRRSEGLAALQEALEVLPPEDVYYANAQAAAAMETLAQENDAEYRETRRRTDLYHAIGEQYVCRGGKWRFYSQPGYSRNGWDEPHYPLYYASRCGGWFPWDDAAIGDSITSECGKMTLAADRLTVETPAGTFENCRLWCVETPDGTAKNYFCRGVGLVKQVRSGDQAHAIALKAYTTVGDSDSWLPFAEGNVWEYDAGYPEKTMLHVLRTEICHADDTTVTAATYEYTHRTGWDEDSFDDMFLCMRQSYCRDTDGDREVLVDVSDVLCRLEALAETPRQKAQMRAAAPVMRRIFDTDPTFHPAGTEKGHWNFYNGHVFAHRDATLVFSEENHFEWKDMTGVSSDHPAYPLLYNDIYGLLDDAMGVLWSDAWKDGYAGTLARRQYRSDFSTAASAADCGTVTTPAGTFLDCLALTVDITGRTGGLWYRNGHMVFTFAPGVGIVKLDVTYAGDRTVTYALTAYEGTGEGLFPIGDGLYRRYDALNTADGYTAYAAYYYAADDDGSVHLFEDRCGTGPRT